jgi:hypothetical protein
MTSTKFIDNHIAKRRTNIVKYAQYFFPKDIANLISNYDYYLEGISYTFKDSFTSLNHDNFVSFISLLPDGRIISAMIVPIIHLRWHASSMATLSL